MRYEFALGDPCIILTSVRLQYRNGPYKPSDNFSWSYSVDIVI